MFVRMKTILLFLLFFPLFIYGQNRFEKEFIKADSIESLYLVHPIERYYSEMKLYEDVNLFQLWDKYVEDCKKPYYKDTLIFDENSKGTLTSPYRHITLYKKIIRNPNWEDFWNRYLREKEIVKFE